MKKVGIMSMQRIYNYGSFLQAYGLKQILNSLDVQAKFIDYHPGIPLIKNDQNWVLTRNFEKVLETLRISSSLANKLKYIKYKKTYKNKYYPLLGISNETNYATDDLDLLIIGSDEVFNCVQNNPKVGFSPDLFGVNSNAKRLITYAASFGNTTLPTLCKYKKEKQVLYWLSKFDGLSVRDENSFNIVKKATSKVINSNLDPVLIYDFMNKEKIPNTELPYKYLVLYGYNGRFSKRECKLIKQFAKNNRLKIICIGGIQHYCDVFLNCNPLEVLSYFNNAEYVITDTFHGTIMSIITKRKFVTFVRKNGYGNSQKIEDLLRKLHLNNRILDNLNNMEEKLSREFDYTKVDKIIEKERKKAIDYLNYQIEKA